MASKVLFGRRWSTRFAVPVVVAIAVATAAGAPGFPTAEASGNGAAVSNWFVTGTFKGQTLQGPVTVFSLTCAPINVGASNGVQVIWGGTVLNNATGKSEQISGDMSFPQFGSWTIPTSDPHTPVASMVVAGDYSDRYGLSSGVGGIGNGNLTADAGSGSVDATYSTGSETLSLKGSWTCTGAAPPPTTTGSASTTTSSVPPTEHRTPTVERQTAQQDLVNALEAAKGPCLQEAAALGVIATGGVTIGVLGAVPGGATAGGSISATGQVMQAIAGPLCVPMITRIAKDIAIINDPPDAAIHELPAVAPVAAVTPPSCIGVDPRLASYCQRLAVAAARVATDELTVAGATDAIATAVARESGANATGDAAAAANQERNARALVDQLAAALRTQAADGAAMAGIIRSEHVSMTLTTDQSAQAIQVLLADVARQGVTSDEIRPLAGTALTPHPVDVVEELAHPGVVQQSKTGGSGGAPVGLIVGLVAILIGVAGAVYATRRRLFRRSA